MKEKILHFLHSLIIYDYILFGVVFVLFFLLLILTILLRSKPALSLFVLLLSLIILFGGPIVGYIKLHEILYKKSCVITDVKALEFTPALVVNATITNESKRIFSTCKITAKLSKVFHYPYIDTLLTFNPFQTTSVVENNISIGETRALRIVVEPFTYTKDYNLTLGADCR